ncbi:hypothetical protein [Allobranchiibius sp. GilTou38]|uniref:hypothetical protein n=1 Tax=Allobranchiibius sp. GilTou38 TaxID=2815210 RepID=UPI001AA0E606|nr:hypothetical protein [Allobranchiibius sp. GilTou38]MBO1768304.1 hypothetical protein [Allobranchiibius sp. GilTou38]
MSDLTFVLAGPVRHGVRLHAQALGRRTRGAPLVNIEDGTLPPGPVHLHFTDRIFGRDALDAAERLAALVGTRPLSVTLHDLPQPSDGASFERRRQGYARVVAGARGVQVSSEHERGLLEQVWGACGDGAMPPVAVVPLPVDRPTRWGPPAGAQGSTDGAVVVLGFVYPGKGHAETLAAMASLPTGVPLVAVGAPSDGHEDLLTELEDEAAAQGRSFVCTGYVTDGDLERWTARAGTPVSAHTHISASGSINRWISAARRPIVTPGAYVGELHRRAPWAVTVAADLPAAIGAALHDPTSTWIREAEWDGAALPDTGTAAAMQLAAIEAIGLV